MPRLLVPDAHHPILQFRYLITTSKLPTAAIYGKAATQPTAQGTPVTVEYINSYIKVKGKLRWDSITMSCYNFEGITATELWTYLQDHQAVSSATDTRAPAYKHDLSLMLLGPDEAPVGTWKLIGAFFESVAWGSHDRGTDDVSTAELTICYDYATYS
jgi:hypothetical protein